MFKPKVKKPKRVQIPELPIEEMMAELLSRTEEVEAQLPYCIKYEYSIKACTAYYKKHKELPAYVVDHGLEALIVSDKGNLNTKRNKSIYKRYGK